MKSLMRSQSSEEAVVRRSDKKPHSIISRTKKYEDRKYSGDLKFTMFASKKLFEK